MISKIRIVLLLVIILSFLLLAIVLTRPIAVRSHNAVVEPHYDPLAETWVLDWDLYELFQKPFNLFNANIFYPNSHTLAYSDHQIVNAILASPIMAITNNPV